MKKEFIPYEQALDLKELGFDEEVEFYKDLSEEIFDMRTPNDAPCILWQQAFRWFREKHKLYHTINMFGDWDKPQYSYLVSGRTMNNPAHMWHFEDKDSHEEAELECLIKLIEIVKNK
jgi:hypothetical protein